MKKAINIFLFVFASFVAIGQMDYQAIVLDSDDKPLENQGIGLQIKIRSNTPTGSVEYQEIHPGTTTDDFGRIAVTIGQGTAQSGDFNTLDRAEVQYLEVLLDVTGGTTYTTFSITELKEAYKTAYDNSIKLLNQANHEDIKVDDDKMVLLQELITLDGDYIELNEYRLHVSGGGFVGSGIEEVRFGQFSVIEGLRFENVAIDALHCTFVNCLFINVSELGSNNVFQGGDMNNSVIGINNVGNQFIGMEIDNSTIPRADALLSCVIDDSFLGNFDHSITSISNCPEIDDCLIFVETFIGNNCSQTTVRVDNSTRQATISNNRFDEELDTEPFILVMDRTGSFSDSQVTVSNNIFFGGSNGTDHIHLFGTFSDSGTKNSTSHFEGNTFTKGDDVISNITNNVKIIFSNNVLNLFTASDIGLSGANTFVDNNFIIP